MKNILYIIFVFCIVTVSAQEDNYVIKNLDVNTENSDYGVAYYGNNVAVFASSRKDKSVRKRVWGFNNQPYLELYSGAITKEGGIIEVERFSKKLNSKYHESNATFTKDLKTVYFSRNNYLGKKFKKDSAGVNLIQLYRANVGVDGDWTNIQALPFNSDNYQTGHPVLNSKEDKLFFTSDMPGAIGQTDIFVVDVNSDGSFGEPINLGENVNTAKKEMFPFIDRNDVLYFSSNGYAEGKGGLDIYASIIVGDKATEKAKNIGAPMNSEKDDFSLVFSNTKREGYFSSNRTGGKGDDDIYSFKEINPVSFECIQLASGVVRSKDMNELISEATVELQNEKGEVVATVVTDQYGAFSFKVNCLSKYRVYGSKPNYSDDYERFNTSNVPDAALTLGLKLEADEFVSIRGLLMININPIYFDLDEFEIKEVAAIELEKVARIMKKYPKLRVDLGSHTDSRGEDKYNMDLSENRVKSSLNWLISRGIDAAKINSKGYGETKLVNKCSNGVTCTEGQHQLNRRTEFIILNPEEIK